MTFDEAMQKGELLAAVGEVERDLQAGRVPAKLFILFQLKAVLEDFAGARLALDEIRRLQPSTAPLLDDLGCCLEADRQRASRRRDPEAAGKRVNIGTPPKFQLSLVKAGVHFAQGDKSGAASAARDAREQAPRVPGILTPRSGERIRFRDLSDSDDLVGPVLEAISPKGALEIPFCQIAKLKFRGLHGFQDTLWIPADVTTTDGHVLPTRIPAQYVGSGKHAIPAVRLGNVTTWDRESGVTVAFGQRDLRFTTEQGEAMVGIRQVQRIDFEPAVAAPEREKKGLWQRLFS